MPRAIGAGAGHKPANRHQGRADIRDVIPSERNTSGAAGPRRPAVRWLVLAVSLLTAAGCSVATDPPDETFAAATPAAEARMELPDVPPGVSTGDLRARLSGWPEGRRFTGEGAQPEGWEWSGPDGMRVEAYVSGSRVIGSRVSRTWGSGVPPVEGRELPGLAAGGPLTGLLARIGPGLLVERTRTGGADGVLPRQQLERYRWAIHDRGLDTGLFLVADARDGLVVAVTHPWSRR